MEVKKFKASLFNSIEKIKLSGLVNISLVGSFQYSKNLSNVNDIDLVIIVNDLSLATYKNIISEFKKIAKKLSNSRVRIMIEDRIGPLKPAPIKSKKVIQLHLLVFDIVVWKKRKSPSTFDWASFNKRISGVSLKSITNIKVLSKKAVIKDIKESLLDLKQKTAFIRVYKFSNSTAILEVIPIKLTKEGYCENLIYNILISFLNYIRYFKPTLKNNKALVLLEAKSILPHKYFSLVRDSFNIKERIRNGGTISLKDLVRLNKEGINFIRFLIQELSH